MTHLHLFIDSSICVEVIGIEMLFSPFLLVSWLFGYQDRLNNVIISINYSKVFEIIYADYYIV